MSPLETAMLTKVTSAAAVLFVIAYIGNLLTFSSRLVNALVTAILFAAIYAGLFYLIDQSMLPPEMQALSQETWVQMIAMSAVLVFVVDLVANMLSFSNRFVSALVTAVVFAALYVVAIYATGGVPTVPTAA